MPLPTTPPPGAEVPEPHPDAPPPGTLMPEHYGACFGCGQDHPGGLRLQATVGEGLSLTARFLVTDAHQGAPGLAHGGVLTAAFDEAQGYLMWLLRKPAVTGRLETDFRRPVPVGSTLHITARLTGVDGRKLYAAAEGRLDAPDGPLALTSASLFVEVPISHFVDRLPAGPGGGSGEGTYNP